MLLTSTFIASYPLDVDSEAILQAAEAHTANFLCLPCMNSQVQTLIETYAEAYTQEVKPAKQILQLKGGALIHRLLPKDSATAMRSLQHRLIHPLESACCVLVFLNTLTDSEVIFPLQRLAVKPLKNFGLVFPACWPYTLEVECHSEMLLLSAFLHATPNATQNSYSAASHASHPVHQHQAAD